VGSAQGRGRNVIALGAVLLGWHPSALALDRALDVNQYAHTAWTVRDGFSKGTIDAIAQTQDGYLWLGTEFGLLRFDGVRSVPWQPPDDERLPSSYVHSLLAARDGRLWIGTAEGLASWENGKLTRYAELAGQSISALLEDHEGTVWAGGHAAPTGGLCAIHSGKVQCYGQDGSFGQYVDSLVEDRAGNLWVGGLTGLWRWKPGPPKLYRMPDRAQALMEGENGTLVIAMLSGFRQFANGKLEAYPLPAAGRRFTADEILRDRDGGLWIGTRDRGLVHVHQGRTDMFGRSDGLSGDFTKKLFEDREGNVWVATLDGLDRFRDLAVPTISVKQGLSNATVESVLAAGDGSVWLGTADGLNRWNNGRITVYRKRSVKANTGDANSAASEPGNPSNVREITGSGLPDDAIEALFQDFRDQIWVSTRRGLAFFENGRFTPVNSVPGDVHSIAGNRTGDVWVSQAESLFRVRDGSVVERIPWTQLGRPDGVRSLVADPVSGGLWLAFRDGGVGYFKDGQVRTLYTVADGLGEGHIRDIQLDREGTLWASTEGGLSRLKDGRFITLTSKNGLPCDSVHWVMEDDDHSCWLYMACGLVRLRRSDLDAWAAAAKKDPKRRIQATVFDGSDGVRSHSTTTGYSPSVAKSADGKLWFLPWDGVSVIDPRSLPVNTLSPPVHVEQITADRQTYDALSIGKGRLPLPSLIRDLEIDYTALSLVAPEKVFFRYKLDGRDPDWQDVGNRRQAFYSNLPPGNYSFRVSATNNGGVWNEAGTSLDFSVAPAYYQTTWFRLGCVAAFLALLGVIYQLRLGQVARQFNMRLEERVRERTRIAQELHDTLLQGFLSASMQVHVAVDRLPEDSQAKPILTRALEVMGQVIEEGRDAVRGLRVSQSFSLDLEHAFSLVRQELGAIGREDVEFRVIVDGQQRPLRPSLGDEVYRIGREALLNAFRHSRANQIEIELEYSPTQLRVFVRDNGSGIDPSILNSGRDGHWGLSGMRERADRIGARFQVLSRASAGTEIQLAIPGRLAFQDRFSRKRRWFGNGGPTDEANPSAGQIRKEE
jgi:signal transduction histidine kinase/ligand-binding sensor domain-containing protein